MHDFFEEVDELVYRSPGRTVVIGWDTQASIGPLRASDSSDLFGSAVLDSGRNFKGDLLTQWCSKHRVRLLNTFCGAACDSWTWFSGMAPPKQIDYIGVGLEGARDVESSLLDIAATSTDHRPLYMALTTGATLPRRMRTAGYTAKPISWVRTDRGAFCYAVNDALDLADPSE